MRKTLGNVIRIATLGAMIGSGSSCTELATSQSDVLFSNLGVIAAQTVVQETIRGQLNPYDRGNSGNNTNGQFQVLENRLDEYFDGSPLTPPSFTCSDFRDMNCDGTIEKDELIGLGSYFQCKEKNKIVQVTCGSTWTNVLGKKIIGKITNNNTGEIIISEDKNSNTTPCTGYWVYVRFTKGDSDSGIEPHTVEWLVDGRLMPTRTIHFFVDYGEKEITPTAQTETQQTR